MNKLILCLVVMLGLNSVVNAQTIDEKIAQMVLIGFRGTSIDASDPIYSDIKNLKIGGVVLYDTDIAKGGSRNIESPKQLLALDKSLQAISKTPLFIAIDQEGGNVKRLKPENGFPDTKRAFELGKMNDLEQTYAEGEKIALMLKSVDINFNFAPVTDVATNLRSPIIGTFFRSFSDNPEVVYEHSKEYVKAHRAHKIVSTLKHFPGYGSATGTKKDGFIDVSKTWDELELIPYIKLQKDGLIDAIMVSHIYNSQLDAVYPASLSKKVITDLLRHKMGFEGVIIGESPQDKAVMDHYGLEKAIEIQVLAGVDMVQFANNRVYHDDIAAKVISIVKKMIKDGKITEKRIDESYKRIMNLKKNL